MVPWHPLNGASRLGLGGEWRLDMESDRSGYKHTPGPWNFEKVRRFGGGYDIVSTDSDDGYQTIGSVGGSANGSAEANARLVSAAPEMLAACRAAFAYFDGGASVDAGLNAKAALLNAIRKADGVSECASCLGYGRIEDTDESGKKIMRKCLDCRGTGTALR